MSHSTISRGPRTVLVGIGLVCVYFVYSRMTSPWLTVERKAAPVVKSSIPQEKSEVFSEQAKKWFVEDPWVQTANARFRDGGRLLFFNEHELDNDNTSVVISPVAFLWQQEDDEIPVTATADSAQLDSSTSFDFQEARFGRIVSGFLAGDVRITGPDGLRIQGRMFHIDENAMRVWTNQPVDFAWGTHSGRAESGAEIELLSSADSSKAGLMAVNDVQRIRLLGRIDCHLSFEDKDSERAPIQLHVSAANGFEFFVPTRQATFSGFKDRPANLDNQVLVERPSPDGTLDRLHCSQLQLHFQPRIQTVDSGKPSRQLQLTRISAEGTPAEFWTTKNGEEQIFARMGKLQFRIREHILELEERVAAASGKRSLVEVHQGGTKLLSGHVQVTMNDNNDVTAVNCFGEGRIGPSSRTQQKNDQPKMIGAAWKESLVFLRGEKPRITLTGEARVVQASENTDGKLKPEFSMSSRSIDMYLENAEQTHAVEANKVSDTDVANPMQGLNMSRIRPRLMVATGDVTMVAPDLSGKAREKLTVEFQHSTSVVTSSDSALPGAAAGGTAVKTVSQTDDPTQMTMSGTTSFLSDTVEARLTMLDEGKSRFEDVWLKGGVEVSHKAAEGGDSTRRSGDFTASGNILSAKGGFEGNTAITLVGDPATVVNSRNRIEGKRIDLTQMKSASSTPQNQANVESSGRIRFVSDTGLDGRPLAKPSPIDIYWGDHMSFNGRTAHFVGNVRAVMNNELDHDVELTCAGMKVHFSDDLQLQSAGKKDEFTLSDGTDSQTPAGGIERIECESRVVVDIDVMEDGVVKAHHHAEFADLEFNQITGEFHATGPGFIESVQPDNGNRRLATTNRTVARSNTPAKTSAEAFYYLRADFIGELQGDSRKNYVRLKQHIRGIFGPVRELTDRLSIDGLTAEELPENTGALECENLSVSAVPGVKPEEGASFSLVAESNSAGSGPGTRSPCRFESKLFAGLADKIKYDHSKQQFILLADEGRQAVVSYHPNGGKRQTLNGGRFEYYTDRNYLNANQITGVQSTGDLSID